MQDLQIGVEVEKRTKCVITYVGCYKIKQGTATVDCQYIRKQIDGRTHLMNQINLLRIANMILLAYSFDSR
jgi:hypothetical protein